MMTFERQFQRQLKKIINQGISRFPYSTRCEDLGIALGYANALNQDIEGCNRNRTQRLILQRQIKFVQKLIWGLCNSKNM